MSQKRVQDYGSPVVAQSLKTLSFSIVSSAILDGMQFAVDGPSRLRINPGSAVTGEGVIIIEDESLFLDIPNTSSPVDYTVYYLHKDEDISGGIPATLTLESGLLDDASINGVVIGYVRYPGGGVPLNTSHFIQPYSAEIGAVRPTRENADWIIPIRETGYMITNTTGTTDITDTFDTGTTPPQMYVQIRNNTVSITSLTLTFPFKVGANPYALLQMILGTDINATVSPSFIDSDGNVLSLLTSPFSGSPDLSLESVEIPRESIQNPNSIVYLQLEIALVAAREIKLQSIGLSQYNLPL